MSFNDDVFRGMRGRRKRKDGYEAEPKCEAVYCLHPKVVHKGDTHDGRCIAKGCSCERWHGPMPEAA